MKWSSFSLAALCCLALAGCRRPVERIEWPVMGTVAAVQVRGGGGLPASSYRQSAADAFAEVERLLNAHNPDSELSRLAPLGNDAVLARCDARMRPCYAAAFALERLSGGAFSPRWRGTNTLDLGAIAKGFAVDLAAESTYVDGNDALLDLGGNLKAIQGEGGSRRPWRTGIRDPGGDGFAAEVDLREGEALATSATYFRGSHIRDARTGATVSNGVASVTVLARSAMWADGLSTALFVLGPDAGAALLHAAAEEFPEAGVSAALWLLSDGSSLLSGPSSFRFHRR